MYLFNASFAKMCSVLLHDRLTVFLQNPIFILRQKNEPHIRILVTSLYSMLCEVNVPFAAIPYPIARNPPSIEVLISSQRQIFWFKHEMQGMRSWPAKRDDREW